MSLFYIFEKHQSSMFLQTVKKEEESISNGYAKGHNSFAYKKLITSQNPIVIVEFKLEFCAMRYSNYFLDFG